MRTREEIIKAWEADKEEFRGIYEAGAKRGDEHYGRPSWYYERIREAESYYMAELAKL